MSRGRKARAGLDPPELRRFHISIMDALTVAIELRDTDGGPTLHGIILTEGRAGRRRAELFAPGSVTWPASGIAIRTEHRGPSEVTAIPERRENGEIRIAVPATPAIVAAVKSGKNRMSVEFAALREHRTESGIREIERAFVDGAALSDAPEYAQTAAEVRDVATRGWWTYLR